MINYITLRIFWRENGKYTKYESVDLESMTIDDGDYLRFRYLDHAALGKWRNVCVDLESNALYFDTIEE